VWVKGVNKSTRERNKWMERNSKRGEERTRPLGANLRGGASVGPAGAMATAYARKFSKVRWQARRREGDVGREQENNNQD
jgi:hypothetical protein